MGIRKEEIHSGVLKKKIKEKMYRWNERTQMCHDLSPGFGNLFAKFFASPSGNSKSSKLEKYMPHMSMVLFFYFFCRGGIVKILMPQNQNCQFTTRQIYL